MKRALFLALAVAAALTGASRTASDFFANAPEAVVRLLPQSTRLDMVDYFNYGSKKASENFFGGPARVIALTDNRIEVQIDEDVTMQMAVIPSKTDTIIAVVTTVAVPARDSSLKFYGSDWQPLKKSPIAAPAYEDWLTKEGRPDFEEISMLLPFIPASAEFSDDASTLTFRNSAAQYLSADDFNRLSPKLKDAVVYDINSGRFTLRK